MTKKDKKPTAPQHLSKPTSEWFRGVLKTFELEEHHVRLLTLAAEAWDRCQQARESIQKNGLTYQDRFDQPHARPEISIERDSRTAFCRTLRELGLDVEEPKEQRPPTIVASRVREAI